MWIHCPGTSQDPGRDRGLRGPEFKGVTGAQSKGSPVWEHPPGAQLGGQHSAATPLRGERESLIPTPSQVRVALWRTLEETGGVCFPAGRVWRQEASGADCMAPGRWRLQWAVVCTLAAWGIRVPRDAWRAIEHVPSWKAHNQGTFRPDEETLRKRRGIVLGKRETGRRWKGPARERQEIIQGRGPYWASLQSLLRCSRRASVWRSAWQRATRCCRENCKQHRLDEEDFAFFL